MPEIVTTQMSPKGQVKIPKEVREKLSLKPGDCFLVVAEKDVLLLKLISRPSLERLDKLLSKARKAGREAGITPQDIENALQKVRRT